MSKGKSKLFTGTKGEKANNSDNTIRPSVLEHASKGEFIIDSRACPFPRPNAGGHGQENLDFLNEHGIPYQINVEYNNGVRVGSIPCHKKKVKRSGNNQAWFPASWDRSAIRLAGEHVAGLRENQGKKDGEIMFGRYNGVRVGVIRTNGVISTIFPDADQQP